MAKLDFFALLELAAFRTFAGITTWPLEETLVVDASIPHSH
jgi:hypothetical protein